MTARLVEPLFFFTLAIALTWPLATSLDTAIPQGQESAATVPLFNLWTIWWNADRAASLWSGYWNAPIFAPVPNAFAFSESQPVTGIVAPVVWLTESRALAYNLYLLLTLTANGWSGSLLVRSLTRSRAAGVAGGTALAMLPFVHWQSGVLQLTSLTGILLTLHFLRKFFGDERLVSAAGAGASIAFCYLCCNYYGYQLGLVLLFSWPLLLTRHSCLRKIVFGLVLGCITAGALVLPVVGMQLSVARHHEWNRGRDLVARLSATQDDYWRAVWRGPLSSDDTEAPHYPLSPGLACVLLATIGAIAGLRKKQTRSFTAFLLAFTAVAAQLSLGPGWMIRGFRPFEQLTDWLPGLSALRSPYRFAVLVQVGCVLLAASSFHRSKSASSRVGSSGTELSQSTGERCVHQPSGKPWRPVLLCLQVVLAGGVLLESRPERPQLYELPEYRNEQPWIDWLANKTSPDDIVASLPFPSGRGVSDYQESTVAMLWGTYHQRRLVNGYSGFFPESFVQLKRKTQRFPEDDSIRALRNFDVRWCIVDVTRLAADAVHLLSEQPQLSLRFVTDDGRTRIYEVAGSPD